VKVIVMMKGRTLAGPVIMSSGLPPDLPFRAPLLSRLMSSGAGEAESPCQRG
jgi:hypothetical protein